MVGDDLKEWYEKHRYADLRDAKTKKALRELLAEESFLSPKARRRLFEHFIEEEIAGVGMEATMEAEPRREGVWRNVKTGQFAKAPSGGRTRKGKRWESWE